MKFQQRGAFAAGIAALTLLATWVVWPAFEPGRILNLDAPRHLLRAKVMAEQFLPSGHVDGWSPWWYLGAQLFLFQSYGFFALVGATAIALAPFASLEAVFKAFYVSTIVALPAATVFLARGLGVSRAGALVAGFASLAFSSPLGFGIQGVFGIGLLLQGVGIVAFAVAWPFVLDALMQRDSRPWTAVLMLAGVVLLHFISGAYALAAAGMVAAGLAFQDRDPRPLLRYLVIATAVLLLAGHSLFPSLEWRELSGAAVGWGTEKDRLDRFVTGTLFGARPLALAGIAAAAAALTRARSRLSVTALVLFGTAFLGGANEQAWEPAPLAKLLDVLVRPRALPYAALFLAVFAGAAVDEARRGAAWLHGRFAAPLAARLGGIPTDAAVRRIPLPLPSAVVAGVVLLVCLDVLDGIRRQRHFVRTEAKLQAEAREPYLRLVDWLKANVEPGSVVNLSRKAFPSHMTGARSAVSLLNMDTGLYTLGGDQAELTRAGTRFGRVDLDRLDVHPARYAKVLRGSGVSHVIVTDPGVRSGIVDQPDFEPVYEYEMPLPKGASKAQAFGITVYRLKGGGQRLHGSAVDIRPLESTPERLAWRVRVKPGLDGRELTASVSWHPNWVATVDGEPVPIARTRDEKLSFEVPDGPHEVVLEFVRSDREAAFNAVSAATFLLVGGASILSRRRRRADM